MNNIYTPAFYNAISDWSVNSAKVIVPLVMDLINPKSVIDVGCGDGSWLTQFKQCGVEKITGLDGDYMTSEY